MITFTIQIMIIDFMLEIMWPTGHRARKLWVEKLVNQELSPIESIVNLFILTISSVIHRNCLFKGVGIWKTFGRFSLTNLAFAGFSHGLSPSKSSRTLKSRVDIDPIWDQHFLIMCYEKFPVTTLTSCDGPASQNPTQSPNCQSYATNGKKKKKILCRSIG